MSLRVNPRAWIGALVALYLVVLFPACWSGAQIRAKQLGLAGPSSSNNNEEREEHEQHEAFVHDALGQRPPPPPTVAIESSAIHAEIAYVPRLADSLVPPPLTSDLTVRRLL